MILLAYIQIWSQKEVSMVALASEIVKKFVLILIGRLSMTNGDAGGSMLFSSTFMETNI